MQPSQQAGPRFLIDNSVWQRQNKPAVKAALTTLLLANSPHAVLLCPPVAAEVGFSARGSADHDVVRAALAAFPDCNINPSSALVLELQNSLFKAGLFRAVGAIDTVIAAYAIVNNATVVHYDSDFEYVAQIHPNFRQQWIVPRGSTD